MGGEKKSLFFFNCENSVSCAEISNFDLAVCIKINAIK